MNRRKLLLGSGVALSTTLAGCSSDDTSSEDPANEPTGRDATKLAPVQTLSRYDTEIVTREGTGSGTATEFNVSGRTTAFALEYEADGLFTAILKDATTRDQAAVVFHELDRKSATKIVPLEPGNYYLDVTHADGSWTVEVANPDSRPEEIHDLTIKASGSGKEIVGPVTITGDVTIQAEHTGDYFVAELISEAATTDSDREVVFYENGGFEGSETVQYDGVSWVAIDSVGRWSLKIE